MQEEEAVKASWCLNHPPNPNHVFGRVEASEVKLQFVEAGLRRVDLLWQQSARPSRPSLASLPLQLHKDCKACIESAREACFPNSREGAMIFPFFPETKYTRGC